MKAILVDDDRSLRRMGYLPEEFAEVGEKAVQGVLERIDEDGTVHGVAYGTLVFRSL